jgi:hypothetical protein
MVLQIGLLDPIVYFRWKYSGDGIKIVKVLKIRFSIIKLKQGRQNCSCHNLEVRDVQKRVAKYSNFA